MSAMGEERDTAISVPLQEHCLRTKAKIRHVIHHFKKRLRNVYLISQESVLPSCKA